MVGSTVSEDTAYRRLATLSHSGRLASLVLFFSALAVVLWLFRQTFSDMVSIWYRSETFHHGFLIAPISAYLAWTRRAALSVLPLRPWWLGLIAILAGSILWWLSSELSVAFVEQLSAVFVVVALVPALLGKAYARCAAFPLAFLFLAVPFGEFAIPYLIEYTASFTVFSLQILGFPVIREGIYFSIPAGNFEVVKACSGIRYLLASFSLGTLYGYLVFDGLKKRIAMSLLSLILPIVANGARALGIVLLAHYSDMQMATGVDHIVYGWLFFGIVMLTLFWIGGHFRDPESPLLSRTTVHRTLAGLGSVVRLPVAVAVFMVAIAAASTGPIIAAAAEHRAESQPVSRPAMPSAFGMWRALAEEPNSTGSVSALNARSYSTGRAIVDVSVATSAAAIDGLVEENEGTRTVDLRLARIPGGKWHSVPLGSGSEARVREWVIGWEGNYRLVWVWSELDQQLTTSVIGARLRELPGTLLGRPKQFAAFAVSVDLRAGSQAEARVLLDEFVLAAWAELRACAYEASTATMCTSNESAKAGRK